MLASVKKEIIKSAFRALGTEILIQIAVNASEKEKAGKDIEKAKEIYRQKEKIFSRFDPESEMSRLNQNLGVWQNASPDILYLSQRILEYGKISGGLYDPRIVEILEKIGYDKDFRSLDFANKKSGADFDPINSDLAEDLKIDGGKIFFGRRMDFSGVAKGYITDCATKFLKESGWENFLADSGGDMYAAGKNAEGEDWKIEVEGADPEKLMLEISERGVATSGISRKKWEIAGKKYHHLVNPKNPNEYSYELRTVSVISENVENADGRAKTLVLMGKEKGFDFAEQNKIAAVFLDYRGDINITSEAKKFVSPEHSMFG
ncbi:MAG: FAD:protein FMN transferase [Candidatus Moranbacteria bacterium]|nr:FAD:protein FMN transferase [Candidatus Moranbacteria bacterium]